jgi:hypothetical protein
VVRGVKDWCVIKGEITMKILFEYETKVNNKSSTEMTSRKMKMEIGSVHEKTRGRLKDFPRWELTSPR